MSTKAKAQSQVVPKLDAPIQQDPEKMGGTPTIGKYRLPVETLIDYLAGNHRLNEFLDEFPGSDRETVLAVLGVIRQAAADGLLTSIQVREEHDYRLFP
ncbi:MAG: DUF433 domain-containing protein [Blastocatellia bacterium]